jgi:hypothetical protein
MLFIRSLRSLLVVLAIAAAATVSFAQIGVSVTVAPPALPVYDQPLCPGDGYLWTPGYWAWDDGYYWVPGTWVLAPEVGFLWTPPWWGWEGGGFLFHEGYWGPTVGFYGGISYGFGYFGVGFEGGRWDGGRFFYNRAVANINVTNIHNVYNTTINRTTINRVSYNGGNGGITARPTPQEEAAARERHIPPVAAQTDHVQTARSNPELRESANHGNPSIAATSKAGDFRQGVVGARGSSAPGRDAGNAQPRNGERNGERPEQPARTEGNNEHPATAIHPNDLAPMERPARPNTGDPKLDKKYQKEQDKLYQQQNKERQKLQQQQDKEHQKMEKQNANEQKKQQMEQRHQQQTQQMTERHTQQMQQMQTRQAPAPRPAGRPR